MKEEKAPEVQSITEDDSNKKLEKQSGASTPGENKPPREKKTETAPYLQNRELSWLAFDERVLDQGADKTVPLLDRLNFISIFWSNLQEFFMVRVGSLTDLSLVKKQLIDSKSGMTPSQQLEAIYDHCRELYPIQEKTFEEVRGALQESGISHLRPKDLTEEQHAFLHRYVQKNIFPCLSPQIINSRHPFPHLENGALYVVVRLGEEKENEEGLHEKTTKADKAKNLAAQGVTLGLIPMPHQCGRIIKLPGEGLQFILLEHAIEMISTEVFSMYNVKHTNVICVTRNADLDATEGTDENDYNDENYLNHMKRVLKKRARLAPVRLESEKPLTPLLSKLLLDRLELKPHQVFVTTVPLNMSYTWGLASLAPKNTPKSLTSEPFTPQWPACLDRNRSILDQVSEKEILLSYPYETMDAFIQLLREAARDPNVISIKITLYRLASQSHLAEALIAAAENGKDVTALFELRARFDESNNIEWSQRFEQAGCNVIYGFKNLKVHSKICCITRQTPDGLQHITQLGTGNYNEKTAKLYTDLAFITTDDDFGRNATEFFRNMALENASDSYDTLWVAPLQIKPMILKKIDKQIELAHKGDPCGLFFKTNSITDKDVIDKIVEASQAGVPVTLFVRGISCIVPSLEGYTDNVLVVSIVGRLLEHSRIYSFGGYGSEEIYLSSADLMTRNMEKRVEIAWPIRNKKIRNEILEYLEICLRDTAKLRGLQADKTYTSLGSFIQHDENGEDTRFESHKYLINRAKQNAEEQLVEKTLLTVAAGPEEPVEPTLKNANHEKVFDPFVKLADCAQGVKPPASLPEEDSNKISAELIEETSSTTPISSSGEASHLLAAQIAAQEAQVIAQAAQEAARLASEAAQRATLQAQLAAEKVQEANVLEADLVEPPVAGNTCDSFDKQPQGIIMPKNKPNILRRILQFFSGGKK